MKDEILFAKDFGPVRVEQTTSNNFLFG